MGTKHKYTLSWTETCLNTATVEAESLEEANKMYENGEVDEWESVCDNATPVTIELAN